MNRARATWLAFALCLAVVLAAMAWVSATVVRLERAEAKALRQAAQEEEIRLALWRMDSSVSALVALESSRPYFLYWAFHSPDRAYNRMYQELNRGEVLMPSPLLAAAPPQVLLHFQFAPDGQLTSPQVPTGNMRDLAESGYVSGKQIDQASTRLAQLKALVNRQVLLAALPEPARQPPVVPAQPPRSTLAGNQAGSPPPMEQPIAQRRDAGAASPKQAASPSLLGQQAELNSRELRARSQQQVVTNETFSMARQAASPAMTAPANDASAHTPVLEGAFRPVWMGSALVLARRVNVNGQTYVQGCWLDWPVLRQGLLDSIRESLPGAGLTPGDLGASAENPGRLMAALPVRLIPGPASDDPRRPLSPLGVSLAIAWACVLLAGGSAGLLLRSAMSLSERRGAFVTAVTHELRTPLTTFRLYAEMLAEGMISDPQKRLEYLSTMRAEADRLGHLVENVLSYARLDGPRGRSGVETLALGDMLGGLRDRLAQRAALAGLELKVDVSLAAGEAAVRADGWAVERILMNLVDNACKYAAAGPRRRLDISAEVSGGVAQVVVRDYGPGISQDYAARLFRPFSKSAHEAASSGPGVGLGLALSRDLARNMGGELHHETPANGGARFILVLPLAEC